MLNKSTIITIAITAFIVSIMFLIGRGCNKKTATPDVSYKPQFDSLLKEHVKLLKEDNRKSDSLILMHRRNDSLSKIRYSENRQSDTRLKQKQSVIRKQVENLTKDSLRDAINNF